MAEHLARMNGTVTPAVPRTMPERRAVLVCLDGSLAAETAVPVAKTLAAQLGASLEVLHVVRSSTLSGEKRAKVELALPGVPLREPTGEPAEEILKAAAEPEV